MDDMPEVVRTIARKLGLYEYDPAAIWTFRLGDENQSVEPANLCSAEIVCFTAFAIAAAAGKGLRMRVGATGVYVTRAQMDGYHLLKILCHHECDHTDPLSVCHAQLRALADALGMEDTHGPL